MMTSEFKTQLPSFAPIKERLQAVKQFVLENKERDANAVVLYHSNCMDGLGSAAVAETFLPAYYTNVQYVPCAYNDEPNISLLEGCDVYILDFSFPTDRMKLIAEASDVTFWIDHHISAIKAMEGFMHPKFYSFVDTEHSGVGLTWLALCEESDTMPDWVKFIEDRDLWKFEYTESRAFHAYMSLCQNNNIASFKSFLNAHPMHEIVQQGDAILQYCDAQYKKMADHVVNVSYKNSVVPVINCPPQWSSEVGNMLAPFFPFVILFHVSKLDKVNVSFRSSKDNSKHEDVSIIAKKFNGGGHKHAAGGFMYHNGNIFKDLEEKLNG